MYISHLSLTNFRNYGRLELNIEPGPTLFYGANAQGKTNLLEALYYLATTRSPHADQDQQLLNWDALDPLEPIIAGKVIVELKTTEETKHIEVRLIKEQGQGRPVSFRRQALVNRRKVRLMDLLGNLRVVLFLPQDVQIISGSPALRRRYLDITLCQTDKQYCRTLSAYNKVLEQRNAQLRHIAEFGGGLDVLPVYTDKLVELGSKIFADRAKFVTHLAREAQRKHYEELTDGNETLRLHYLPRLTANSTSRGNDETINDFIEIGEWLDGQDIDSIAQRFNQLLEKVQAQEITSGSTRVGPHRDDWRFWVSGRSLGNFGSRGQQRTALLALKLAEIDWMASQTGDTPILLLDEVVAELDEQRRSLLLNTVLGASQALLTATDPGMFSKSFLEQARTYRVLAGQVLKDKKESLRS